MTISLATSTIAHADTIVYANSVTFQAALGTSITDTYSAPAYQHGNKYDGADQDWFFNAAMSAVLGETDYESTQHSDFNLIRHTATNDYYCAGCNGSFKLTFDSTSVSDASGVFGAGFNFVNTGGYTAFVTFGDMTTANYQLPFVGQVGNTLPGFFGITSDLGIRSIYLGLNGQPTFNAVVAIDDLTIGNESTAASAVPDTASSMGLLVLGLVAVALLKIVV